MRKILSIFLVLVLTFSLCACGGEKEPVTDSSGEENSVVNNETTDTSDNAADNSGSNTSGSSQNNTQTEEKVKDPVAVATKENPTTLGVFYRNVIGADITSDNAAVKEVDKKADTKLKEIENYPDSIKAAAGHKTYYVAANGKDTNDGLSPQKPKKTYTSLQSKLTSGDAVLFRRGDIFRGQMKLISGVSYGAYGSGIKPRFYGSVDGMQAEWKATSTKGVYEYSRVVKYANIIFDNGKAIGRPVQDKSHLTKKALNVYYNGAKLQVYCPEGNPRDVYKSIEIVADYSLCVGGGLRNVKLQNLCLMYTGVHFLGSLGAVYGMEIEGCIMGYCGGRDLYLGSRGTSLGNAVEFWSVAVDIDIHDNYFFQAFDAALTHQGPTKVTKTGQTSSTNYTNIKYRDNLLEYNTYDFEAFSCRRVSEQSANPNGTFTYNDVYITGNICRYTGWGWGSLDRPDKHVYNTFKYDAEGEQDANGNYTNLHIKPLTIENNIFDRSRKGVLGITSPAFNKANMILKNNQFIQNNRANIFGGLTLKDNYEAKINEYFTASGNKFMEVK